MAGPKLSSLGKIDGPKPVKAAVAEPEAEPAKGRKHQSLYLSDAVMREIRLLAIEKGCRPHALFVRGIDLMLRENGRASSAEIDGKEL